MFLGRNQLAFRGIVAVWVLAGHLLHNPIYDAGFARAADAGWLALLARLDFLMVDMMFVLSGCLLSLHYWEHYPREVRGRTIDRFYVRRLVRIYPLHLLGVAMVGAMAWAGIAHPISSGLEATIFKHWEWTGAINLLLMNGWGIVPVASWNEPAWTVSVMFLLYIIFPNLVLGLRRLPQRPLVYWVLVAVILVGYVVMRQLLPMGSHSDGMGALVRGLVFFMVGIVAARLHQLEWQMQRNWDRLLGAVWLLMIGLMLVWWLVPFDVGVFHLLYLPWMLAIMRAHGRVSHVMTHRLCIWLGGIAYSLYILHYPILLLIKAGMGDRLAQMAEAGVWGRMAAYMVVIGLVLLVCYCAMRFIERPLLRLLNKQGPLLINRNGPSYVAERD